MKGRYKAYPEYKDSGIEWLGDVPQHWGVIQIKHLSPVKRGASPRPIDDAKYFDEDGEYAWTRIADVTASDVYLTKAPQRLSDLGSSLSVKLEQGSLFLSIAGTVGKPCITGMKACIHDGFVYFPGLGIPNKFLFYVFAGEQAYKGLGKFGTQLNLNTDTVGGIKIGFAKDSELERIANFLDHETSKIDTLIEKQQQLIKLLKEKRQAVISHAVTKGLNPDALMKDSGVEWLGEVPEHWAVKRLKNVLMESMKNGLFKKKDQFGTGSLLVNVSDLYVDDYFIKLNSLDRVVTTAEEQKIYKVEIGDIFFVRSSLKLEGIGRSACLLEEHEDVVFECHVVKARPSKISTTSKYLVRYLNSPLASQEFIRRSKTTTMTTIDQDNLTTINVVVPPRNEQVLIDSYLDRQLMKIDQADSLAKESMKLYIERRKALISATVTGKIDVRNWKLPEQNKTNKEGTV